MQLWKVDSSGEERKISYLSALVKHTQAVNVVRFSPKGLSLSRLVRCGGLLANKHQVRCWRRQETMEMFFYGCRPARQNWV